MNLESYTIDKATSFETALHEMNRRGKQILLVINESGQLLGTVTDGDLRRAILNNINLETPITEIQNSQPIVVSEEASHQEVSLLMTTHNVHHIPILNLDGVLCGLHTHDHLVSSARLPLQAVVMVGGYGKRLGDLTKNCPKPMLKLGGKPILQTIIEQLSYAGINKISLAVNYLSEQIKEHFRNGCDFGVSIDYLEETEPLGTAGALRLMKDIAKEPLLVINGDILTRVNFGQVLRFHNTHDAVATMCVREYRFQVPYGVVKLDGVEISRIDEKPASTMFINSGIYILNPEALSFIPKSGPFQMTSLFEKLQSRNRKTVAYPIHEYWKDIGSIEDFEKAVNDFGTEFVR